MPDPHVDIQTEVRTMIDRETQELVMRIRWTRQYDITKTEDRGWTEHRLPALRLTEESTPDED